MLTTTRGRRFSWRGRALAAVLVALPVFGIAAGPTWADDPAKPAVPVEAKAKKQGKANKKQAKAQAKLEAAAAETTPEQAEKAREAFSALRDLQAALDKADKAGPKPAAASSLPARPARVVTPPTLDAAGLDELVAKSMTGGKPSTIPVIGDEEFVRRVYLDVTGKIPTLDQIRSFLTNKDKAKRAKLVEALLESPEFSSNLARYWRDVVFYRAPNPNPAQVGYPMYEAWLAEQFAKKRAWDEIASEIITATGPYDENGASAFGLAQMAQPVEMAGEVSRVFMGVQIQCAQCHDHPNAPWKRDQFHEFAAFFAGINSRRRPKGDGPQVFELVSRPGIPRYTKPDLKDPTKSTPVEPKFFLGDAKPVGHKLSSKDRRAIAASYVVGQDNPWFARSFVNRTWTALVGEGFYNPVDDMGPGREATSSEVLETVADQWQKGGYDIRWLYRVVLTSKTYQRESRSTNSSAGRTPFASNCPSRLRGDQIYDALATALDLPLDSLNGRFIREGAVGKGKGAGKAAAPASEIEKMIAKRLEGQPKIVQQAVMANVALRANPRFRFNTLFGIDPSTPSDEVLGTIPQALFLMNSPLVNRGVTAANNTMLGELLKSTPDNRAVLDTLYHKVLARRPTPKEVAVCGRYVEATGDRKEAFEDILWGLINSTEFISRR